MRVEHEICSTMCRTPVRPILDHKNLTGLAEGSGKEKICPRNGLSFASEPSRGPYMGQGHLTQRQFGGSLIICDNLFLNYTSPVFRLVDFSAHSMYNCTFYEKVLEHYSIGVDFKLGFVCKKTTHYCIISSTDRMNLEPR